MKTLIFLLALAVGSVNAQPLQKSNHGFERQTTQVVSKRFVIEPVFGEFAGNLLMKLNLENRLNLRFVAQQGRFLMIEDQNIRNSSDVLRILNLLRKTATLKSADPAPVWKNQDVNQSLHSDPGWSNFNALFGGEADSYNPRVPELMRFTQSLDSSKTGVVAILDVGRSQKSTNDTDSKLISEANFLESDTAFGDARDIDNDPNEKNHAGQIASLYSAIGNNQFGIAGIEQRSGFVQIRAFSESKSKPFSVENSIRWAAGLAIDGVPNNPNPAKVLNLSFGSQNACSNSIQSAIDDAIDAGAIVVSSAGNEGLVGFITQPANCAGVIAVGSLKPSGELSNFSNSSDKLKISTIGEFVPMSDPAGTSELVNTSGTSFSAPVVGAVILSAVIEKPDLNAAQVLNALAGLENVAEQTVNLTNGQQRTICENGSCGKKLDAIEFYEAMTASAVPTATAKGSKALGSALTNVRNISVVQVRESVNAEILTASFDEVTSQMNFESSENGSFQIRFFADEAGNAAGARTGVEYVMNIEVQNLQVASFTNPQAVQVVQPEEPDLAQPVAASGGGGSLNLFGLLGLFCLVSLLKRVR